MISELNSPNKVVGAKQVRRALNDGRAKKLFVAGDADPRVTQPLAQLAVDKHVAVELAKRCLIEATRRCGGEL